MAEKLPKLLKMFYKKNGSCLIMPQGHPDEETLACFAQNLLSGPESLEVSSHLQSCSFCAEALLAQIRVARGKNYNLPQELRAKLKLIADSEKGRLFEIILKNAEKIFELIYTNGQVLMGQEMIPMQGLRSRNIRDFKDSVLIVKDINNIRVEVKIDSCSRGCFNVTVSVRNKKTLKLLKDCRVSLIQSGAELESYVIDKTAVTFEHVLLGKYSLEVSSQDSGLADISVDIKS